MSLKRDRFYQNWYKPRRSKLDRIATFSGAVTALFLLLAVVVSQCEFRSTTARKMPQAVHYLALNGDKMVRVSDDRVVVKNYWEF
jgi:hypothetical protein